MNAPNSICNLTAEEISVRLKQAQEQDFYEYYPDSSFPSDLLPDAPRPAAVLIPFLWKDDCWQVLLTRRQASLPEHSGQVAFPGGRAEPEDSGPEETALREAEEEIGLDPSTVKVVGRLRDFLTITNYRVTPVVGVIPWPYDFRPAAEEVARIFTIPLDWLANPRHFEARERQLPMPFSGSVPVFYFQPYDGEVLWGASAGFMRVLIDILK